MKLRVPVIAVRWKTLEVGGANPHGRAKRSGHSKSFWLNKKFGLGLAALVVLLLLGILSWHNLSSPNYGKVAIVKPDTSPTSKLPEFTTLATNFYRLNYSQRFVQQATDIAPPGILDQKVLADGQSKIEILVKAAPDGGITLDSTYDNYAKHPDQYKLSNAFYHGEAIDIARSASGKPPEAAGMLLHNGYLLIVKITTPDPKRNIDGELKDLLSSVQWSD